MHIPKSPLLMAAAIASTLFFVRCANTPEEQNEAMQDKMEKIDDKAIDAQTEADTRLEWEKDRSAILDDLRDLRDNIDKKLADTNEKLAKKDLKASERTDHEAMKAELVREKEIVEAQITKVEAATPADWDLTRTEADRTRNDVRTWWEKEKEKVDRKTDADKDADGH